MPEARGMIFEAAVIAVVAAILVFASVQRNGVWAGPFSVWEDTIAKSPGKARPHNSLGVAYAASGDYAAAAREFEAASALPSGLHDIHLFNLALALEASGRPEAAAEALKRLLRLAPTHAEARYRLGLNYMDMGRPGPAEAELRAAAEALPGRDDIRNALGNVYLVSRRYADAAAEYRRALELNQSNVEAVYNLAVALDSLGMKAEAIRYYTLFVGTAPGEYAGAAASARMRLRELGAAR